MLKSITKQLQKSGLFVTSQKKVPGSYLPGTSLSFIDSLSKAYFVTEILLVRAWWLVVMFTMYIPLGWFLRSTWNS